MSEKTYKVYAISDGTVIDHIPATKALKVIDILGLENEGILTIGVGFSSQKMGRKDVIKIERKYLKKEETDKISLIAPQATINIISSSSSNLNFNGNKSNGNISLLHK